MIVSIKLFSKLIQIMWIQPAFTAFVNSNVYVYIQIFCLLWSVETDGSMDTSLVNLLYKLLNSHNFQVYLLYS